MRKVLSLFKYKIGMVIVKNEKTNSGGDAGLCL
jgi:hypothetical protein